MHPPAPRPRPDSHPPHTPPPRGTHTLHHVIPALLTLLLATLLSPITPGIRAQNTPLSNYALREWHTTDGLPDEVVHAVAQDNTGYIWVATEEGIARFNGIRFDTFALPEQPAPATTPRGIPAIINHPRLGLLIAFNTGEIYQWNGAKFYPSPLANQFSKGRIATWFLQADNTLWADYTDGRIEFWRDNHVTQIKLTESRYTGRPITFADDGTGGVWIAARSALYHYTIPKTQNADDQTPKPNSKNTPKSLSLSTPPSPQQQPPTATLTLSLAASFDGTEIAINSSTRGQPWIITRDTIGRWDGASIKTGFQISPILGAHYTHDLMEDRDGNLWVATRSQGAYLVTPDGTLQNARASHRTVRSIYQDNEGNIWLATNGGGLDRLQAEHVRLYDSKAGLDDDISFTTCEDNAGNIWLANRDGGLVRIKNGEIEIMKNRPNWPTGSTGRVYPAQDGGIWFTAGSGLFKVDAAAKGFRRTDPAPFKNIRLLYVSRANELWLGGDTGELGSITQNKHLITYATDTGFPHERPSNIVEDSAGRIIISTSNGNLYRLEKITTPPQKNTDPKNQPPPLHFNNLRPTTLPPLAPIRTLLIDENDTLWIGTAGAGLILIANGQEYHLDKTTGLADDIISQMLFDDTGRIWFGTARGIFSADRREIADYIAGRIPRIHTASFGQNEGLERITCLNGYQPHCWKSHDGTLWFTTRRGALAIDKQILNNTDAPPVYIDALLADDTPIPLPSTAQPAPHRIPSTTHRIELLYSVLNYTAPERTPVRYRLENYEQNWNNAGATRKIIYPRLDPGQYTLRIEAADTEGNWNENAAATLTLTIVPRWWQTLWFRATLVIILAALLTLAVRAWSYRLLRRKLERAAREASINRERTRIARDIHDELGASLTRISLLSQYPATPEPTLDSAPAPTTTLAAHHACLDEIYGTTTTITRSINEIVWALDARHDNLESMVSYFDSYAQNFLTLAKIRYRLRAPERIPDIPVSSRVRHDLFLAFKETLNNAVKYARATEVTVVVTLDPKTLTLAITDNGQGLGTAPPHPGILHGGQGLTNLNLRLAALGGHARARNTEQGGVEITLALPIHKIAI